MSVIYFSPMPSRDDRVSFSLQRLFHRPGHVVRDVLPAMILLCMKPQSA
jgi:hypothetical protein